MCLKTKASSNQQVSKQTKPELKSRSQGARRCGLDGEVDPRVGGAIGGIGSAPIVGKVHLTTVAIGGATLPISLLVVEQAIAPFVLGIDVLARHSAVIDLDSAAPSLRIAGAQVPLVLR